jgi:type II secretory pathway pseudopilin PulG
MRVLAPSVYRYFISTPSKSSLLSMISANRISIIRQIGARCQPQTQGFALVEVVVAALLTLIFTAISMQILVMSAAVRVSAQENSESTGWIQEDLEAIRGSANRLDYCVSSTDTGCTGIAAETYKPNFSQCTATTSSSGYAAALQTQIQGTQNFSKSSLIGNRPYTIRRVTSIKAVAPYNILEVSYAAYKGSATGTTEPTGQKLYTYYAEVIPGASFACR